MLYSRSCNVRKTAQIKITYRDSDGWCPYGVRLGPDRKGSVRKNLTKKENKS